MKNLTFTICIAVAGLFAADKSMVDFSQFQNKDQKIAVQNSILSKVNGNIISMMDVKKKMDMVFHQNYPHLAQSNQARVQFYEASWRHVLMEMIDQELMISDALDKEIKIADGDVREVLEERFGPNVMQTLDKIGLTYDETWKMVKNELIVQRMSWWFIHSRATSAVTPQDIRQAYRLYLKDHPAYSEWTYRVVSIRTDQPDDMLAEQIYKTLSKKGQSPQLLQEELKSLEVPGISIAVSNEYCAKTHDLSESHKNALSSLQPGVYGKPSFQMNKVDKKSIYRIFYLVSKNDHPAPAFEDLSHQLRNDLLQKAIAQESKAYLGKLRKHYGCEANQILPEDLHPFSLQ